MAYPIIQIPCSYCQSIFTPSASQRKRSRSDARNGTKRELFCSKPCATSFRYGFLTTEERFWLKVDIKAPDDCWEWKEGLYSDGYGFFNMPKTESSKRRGYGAHVFAWMLTHNEMSNGYDICHHCDNPPCCNPGHLFKGTRLDNMRDCKSKGRYNSPRGEATAFAKLNDEKVREIRRRRNAGELFKTIAASMGIAMNTARTAYHGISWRHVK